MMFKCGHCAGQGRCWNAVAAVSRLGKLHLCSEIMARSLDAPDYPTCTLSPMKGNTVMKQAERHDIAAQIIMEPPCIVFYYWKQALLMYWSCNISSSWCRAVTHVAVSRVVVTPSFTHLDITFSNCILTRSSHRILSVEWTLQDSR
jgi:hypothetical protein